MPWMPLAAACCCSLQCRIHSVNCRQIHTAACQPKHMWLNCRRYGIMHTYFRERRGRNASSLIQPLACGGYYSHRCSGLWQMTGATLSKHITGEQSQGTPGRFCWTSSGCACTHCLSACQAPLHIIGQLVYLFAALVMSNISASSKQSACDFGCFGPPMKIAVAQIIMPRSLLWTWQPFHYY